MTETQPKELRVLILEDVPTDAELVQHELRKAGLVFTARRVSTREGFMRALDEFQPGIVLADFNLPGFTGREALAFARENYPDIPLVIVTGALGDETAVELLRGGARDYVLKDRLARLAPAVQRAIEDARNEAARRVMERRLREIVEHSSNMFYSHTPEQVLTYVSPQSWHFLDCSPEEALVRWTEFVTDNPVNAEGYKKTQRAITTSETQPPYELELRTKKGRLVWVEVHEAPVVRDGKTVAIVGALTDITMRKQSEAALHESETRFASAFHTSPAAITITRIADGKFIDVNQAFLDLFEFKREEVIGRTSIELDILSVEAHGRLIRDQLETGGLRDAELLARSKSGRLVHVLFSSKPMQLAGEMHHVTTLIDITARKLAEDALRRANRALMALSSCNSMLVHAVDEAQLFSDMCRMIVETGGYSHAWIGSVEHDAAKRIRPVAWAGFESDFPQDFPLTWVDNEAGQGPVGIAVRDGMTMVVRDALNDPALAFWRPTLTRLGVNAICVFPLIYGGETFGVLNIYSSERDAFGQDELQLLTELADDLNFGVLTLRTSIERDHAVEKHQHSLEQLRESLEATIGAIAATLEMRDPYTAGHERRVAHLASAIAREMGLPQGKIEGIHFGSLIHDLGKIKVPAEILSKPSSLSKSEFDLVKEHAQSGYDILKGIQFPWPVAEMALEHHERVDGTGYPRGLKGHEMKVESRILAVADVVEAMASHRPYRAALGVEAALEEINAHRGTWYDADAVDACMRLFKEKGFTLDH